MSGESAPQDDRDRRDARPLGPSTRTTIGAACIVFASFAALWFRIETLLESKTKPIAEMQTSMQTVQTAMAAQLLMIDYRLKLLEESSGDRWRKADMRAWVNDIRERNPGLFIPTIP